MFLGLCIFVAAHLIWAAEPAFARSVKALPRQSVQKPTGHVAASWYASWHVQDVPLTAVNWTEYNVVIYAFAVTTPDASEIGLQDSDKQLIPQFVQTARDHGVIPMLSVGGWTGSRFFSSAVATDANRTAFANAIVNVVSQYQLGGIEIDWEYPTRQGMGCNVISSSDSANLLLFFQKLRSMSPNIILSAAVSLKPFLDSNGNPMSDVSGFAKVLDYVEIMNYDVWGSFSTSVGPNAPLDDSCAPAADQQGSAVSAVQAWTQAGFPVDQIILGVPSYGHSFSVNPSDALDASGNLNLYPPFNKANQPAGDKWDGTAGGVDACGNPNVVGGVFDFWGLIDAGFLRANGTPSCEVYHTFDQCSQTPFVYNSTSQVMVSYDDATSFAAKGTFIHDLNLAGFAMWETGGDYNNILVKSIRSAMQMTP